MKAKKEEIASIDAVVYLPCEDGLDLKFEMPLKGTGEASGFGVVEKETKYEDVNFGTVRIDLKTKLYGFAGASAMLNAGVCFDAKNKDGLKLLASNSYKEVIGKPTSKPKTNKDPEDFAETAGEIFAGVKAGCDTDATLQWDNPEDEAPFSSLAQAGYGVNVSAGLGVEGQFKLMIKNGKFFIRAAAGVVCGLGAGGRMAFMVNGNTLLTVAMFVYHKLMEENYDYLGFVQEEAFKVLSAYMVKQMLEPVKALVDVYDEVCAVGEKAQDDIEKEWALYNLKERQIANLVKNIKTDKGETMCFFTPEAKGRMLAMLSQNMFGFDEEAEEAIIELLSWTQSQKEANSILKRVTMDTEPIEIEEGRSTLVNFLDGDERDAYFAWYEKLPLVPFSQGIQVAKLDLPNFPANPSYRFA